MRGKILVASGIFHPEAGGPATYLQSVLPRLQESGWDVSVLTFGAGPEGGYGYPVRRIARRALPLRRGHYALTAWRLSGQADLVYSHNLGLPLWGLRARQVVKIVGDIAWERAVRRGWIAPTLDIDDFQTRKPGLAAEVAKWVRSRAARRADSIIVPSEYLKQMIVGWGVRPEKVHVIYNALPPAEVDAGLTQAGAREQLQLPDAPLLLTVARLEAWKGIDHLITALQALPDVLLYVAGDGRMRATLERQAADAGLQQRVTFLGHIQHDQVALYMKAADYVALYSGYEGLSHTLLESLRGGTPVIASEKGGNPEIVQHDQNGLLVPYVDVDALISTLDTAFAPGKRPALAAHTSAGLERFAFDAMIEKTDAVLQGK